MDDNQKIFVQFFQKWCLENWTGSRQELADFLDMSYSHISNILNGNKGCHEKTRIKICNKIGVDYRTLIVVKVAESATLSDTVDVDHIRGGKLIYSSQAGQPQDPLPSPGPLSIHPNINQQPYVKLSREDKSDSFRAALKYFIDNRRIKNILGLSDDTGLSEAYLSKIKTGECVATPDDQSAIADAYGFSLDEFIDIGHSLPPNPFDGIYMPDFSNSENLHEIFETAEAVERGENMPAGTDLRLAIMVNDLIKVYRTKNIRIVQGIERMLSGLAEESASAMDLSGAVDDEDSPPTPKKIRR